MSATTKRPWVIDDEVIGDVGYEPSRIIGVSARSGDPYCVCEMRPGSAEESDAKLIVLAVNCHEDLLEAARLAFGALKDAFRLPRPWLESARPTAFEAWDNYCAAIDQAVLAIEAAIAKAEGK